MTDRPDFAELIRSPYDDDGDREPKSWGWLVLPVTAAAIGVVVGLGISNGSDAVPETAGADRSTTSTTIGELQPEQATGFPQGYVPFSDDVAVAVHTVYTVGDDTYVVVRGVTNGSVDRSETFMPSVGTWEIHGPGGDAPMVSQAVSDVAPGMYQIRFPGGVQPDSVLVGMPTEQSDAVTVRLWDDAPAEMDTQEPIEIDVDGIPVVIDRLSYNLDRGYAEWTSPSGIPMTVELVITLVGTEGLGTRGELPIRVGSFETLGVFLGTDEPIDAPAWNTSGQFTLDRAGPFRFDEELIERIAVDVIVKVATDLGDPVEIPLS